MASRYYKALFNAVGGKAENDFWTRGELIAEAELGSDQQVERLLKMGAIEPCEPPEETPRVEALQAAPVKPRQPRRARTSPAPVEPVAGPEPVSEQPASVPDVDSLELIPPAAEVPDLPDLEPAAE